MEGDTLPPCPPKFLLTVKFVHAEEANRHHLQKLFEFSRNGKKHSLRSLVQTTHLCTRNMSFHADLSLVQEQHYSSSQLTADWLALFEAEPQMTAPTKQKENVFDSEVSNFNVP